MLIDDACPDWQITLGLLNTALKSDSPLCVIEDDMGFHVYRVSPTGAVQRIVHGLDANMLTAWLHGATTAHRVAAQEQPSELWVM